MAITSASSLTAVAAAYIDSAGYDLSGGSVAMAEEFILACRILQIKRPVSVTVDGNPVTFDYKSLARELAQARSWLSANLPASQGGTQVRTYDMSRVRDRW